jgi:dTMP kinase
MPKFKQGILCAIEGIDGSGKSLLAANLYRTLTEKEFPVLLTKEPGDSPLGAKLRGIVQEQSVPMCAKAEYLLFAADRAQHFDEVVIPALHQKKLVISDRLGDSSLVYQGYGHGLDIAMIKTINHWAMNGVEPDLVIYVCIDSKTAKKRLEQRGALAALDRRSIGFFNNFIKGFDELYTARTNVLHIDGTKTPETVLQQTIKKVISWINEHNLIA